MDVKKAKELYKLTKEFVEKFTEIAKEDKDAALVLSMQATNDNGTTHSATVAVGTGPNTMMAVYHLDKKTSLIKDYAFTNAVIELDKMLNGALFERVGTGGSDNASPSDGQPSGDEQGE